MPVREYKPGRTAQYDELVRELAAEWAQSRGSEPVIYEERDRQGKLMHVYVVWSRWHDIDRAQRSEIIMDAAQKRLPESEWLNITIAMGLEPDEARHLGLGQ